MRFESFFVTVREQVMTDLDGTVPISVFDSLQVEFVSSFTYQKKSSDQYRSKRAAVPAYYNPNSHTVHINTTVLEDADTELTENVFYHELVHAASHHGPVEHETLKVLKSGLKMQVWNTSGRQIVLNRSLNEGFTQYVANMYTSGGPAYKGEVEIVGRLIGKLGLNELKNAYFGPHIAELEQKTNIVLGHGVFERIAKALDNKDFELAHALLD